MPTAAQLRVLLEQTTTPDSGFNVVPVPGHDGYRLGRGLEGSVVLLTPPETQPEAPTSLKRVSLAPRIRCRVESGTRVDEIDAGVVEFRDDDDALTDHFLGVSGALIELLGPTPAPGDVGKSMNRLLRLFAAPDRARGTELGVWGELLLLSSSLDPVALVDAWHSSIDDKFDFSTPGARLEVKTTTRDGRIHHFGLGQLLPIDGLAMHVASIVTGETDTGLSVSDLVDLLRARLVTAPDRQMKVLEMVAATLGNDWPHTSGRRFDDQVARSSVRVLKASDVPRVEAGPPEILDVSLTVDVSEVTALGANEMEVASTLTRLLPSS